MLEKHHPQGDAASVRMADQVDTLETELLEPRANDARVPLERVGRVRPFGETVPGEVQHEDAAAPREHRRHLQPRAMRIAEAMHENEGMGPDRSPPNAGDSPRRAGSSFFV